MDRLRHSSFVICFASLDCHSASRASRRGFSLIELFISMTIVALLLVLMAQVMGDTQSVWTRTRTRTAQFREARAAFESMSRRISQATLNSYWGYRMDATGTPVLYERASELHFVCGPVTTLIPAGPDTRVAGHGLFFQAPLSVTGGDPGLERMEDLMNAWGYYVEFNSDLPRRPAFLADDTLRNPERQRFRLMEFRLPAEKLDLYRLVDDPVAKTKPKVPWIEAQSDQPSLYEWFTRHLAQHAEPVADNVVAIFVHPVTPLLDPTKPDPATATIAVAPLYDTRRQQWENPGKPPGELAKLTRHQLPPELRLTLVALDEGSWLKIPQESLRTMTEQLQELVSVKLFVRPADFSKDMEELQKELRRLRLEFRVFDTAVPIRAARWTTEKN